MIPAHELIPHAAGFTLGTAYPDQFNGAQALKITTYTLCDLNRFIIFSGGLEQLRASTARQLNQALPVQLQHRHPTTHLPIFAVRGPPVKPFTYLEAKGSAGDRRICIDDPFDPLYGFSTKLLAANQHAATLTRRTPCVQQKMWDMYSLQRGWKKALGAGKGEMGIP
jgi:hypothetical protein